MIAIDELTSYLPEPLSEGHFTEFYYHLKITILDVSNYFKFL